MGSILEKVACQVEINGCPSIDVSQALDHTLVLFYRRRNDLLDAMLSVAMPVNRTEPLTGIQAHTPAQARAAGGHSDSIEPTNELSPFTTANTPKVVSNAR